jgi:hypothetical protein
MPKQSRRLRPNSEHNEWRTSAKQTMQDANFFKEHGYLQPLGCAKCLGKDQACAAPVLWRKDTNHGFGTDNVVLICCSTASQLNAGKTVNGHDYNKLTGITRGL